MSASKDGWINDPKFLRQCELGDDFWLSGQGNRICLSCLLDRNLFQLRADEFDIILRNYIVEHFPAAAVLAKSIYHDDFFLVLLREAYRKTKYAAKLAIRPESRDERALRMYVANPEMSEEELANRFPTTLKTVKRWSQVQHAMREYRRLTSDPDL